MAKYTSNIIKSKTSDDADHEWIMDGAIHNTIRKYRNWAEDQKCNVDFTKHLEPEGYGLGLTVTAEFETAEDLAVFNLTFLNELPKTPMKHSEKNWEFV